MHPNPPSQIGQCAGGSTSGPPPPMANGVPGQTVPHSLRILAAHSTTVLGTVLSRNRQLEGRMVEMENSGTSQQAPRRPYWGVMARAPLVTSLSHTSAEDNWRGRGGEGT